MHKPYDELEKDLLTAVGNIEAGALYVHYKSPDKPYFILRVAFMEETGEPCVVYSPQEHPNIVWVRPLSSWMEMVEHEGKQVSRFRKLLS